MALASHAIDYFQHQVLKISEVALWFSRSLLSSWFFWVISNLPFAFRFLRSRVKMLPKSPVPVASGSNGDGNCKVRFPAKSECRFQSQAPRCPPPHPPASLGESHAPPSHSAQPSRLCHLLALKAAMPIFFARCIRVQREPSVSDTGHPAFRA